jgi:hypothetical protein
MTVHVHVTLESSNGGVIPPPSIGIVSTALARGVTMAHRRSTAQKLSVQRWQG